ncbi:ATP-grasp domain-containing protein [Alkalihalophilus sp. As8PL]|uniref:ATP-grasp domain-containing protein n=1 Tax=Alkalihalophilus sp. As8PL TaxID=3237103 RepID=A0AB39BW18_9BACI
MVKKIVAFVEPSFYGVGFVKTAFEMGHYVIAIVSSENNPVIYGYENYFHVLITADIRESQSVLNAIKDSVFNRKLDALIPATDFASHITAKVASEMGLVSIPYEAAFKARNKDLARKAFIQKGVPSVKFKLVKSLEEAKEAVLNIGLPIVLKPTNCASSQGVYFINSMEDLCSSLTELIAFKETYMGFQVRDEFLIEEYIHGPEYSVEVFLKSGEAIFSAVTEKITSPLPFFVEEAHTLPAGTLTIEEEKKLISTAIMALDSIGLENGPAHVELKYSETGPIIIEVNGRPGGDRISTDLLIQSYNFNIFEATISYYLNEEVNINVTYEKASTIAYLTSKKNGTVKAVKGLTKLEEEPNIIKYNINVKEGDCVKIPESSDDRLGYIITKGKTPAESKKIAFSLMNNLRLEF